MTSPGPIVLPVLANGFGATGVGVTVGPGVGVSVGLTGEVGIGVGVGVAVSLGVGSGVGVGVAVSLGVGVGVGVGDCVGSGVSVTLFSRENANARSSRVTIKLCAPSAPASKPAPDQTGVPQV